ncbi:unnamed protein product [Dovyalis caffra]|uniref:Uncharacterized protein n=1 Tax=Dovyalis caffra TaxID=77055 RepID=A0AAV1SWH2_9ROSI|nr:unnamed protein product [Dovyalis caffra]
MRDTVKWWCSSFEGITRRQIARDKQTNTDNSVEIFVKIVITAVLAMSKTAKPKEALPTSYEKLMRKEVVGIGPLLMYFRTKAKQGRNCIEIKIVQVGFRFNVSLVTFGWQKESQSPLKGARQAWLQNGKAITPLFERIRRRWEIRTSKKKVKRVMPGSLYATSKDQSPMS